MTSNRWTAAKALFSKAQNLPITERDRYCRSQVGNDPELLGNVLDLLQAASSAGDFLENPYLSDAPDLFARGRLLTGETTGPYRFGRLVAEAGSSSLYHARRVDGLLQREAAIKVYWNPTNQTQLPRRLSAEVRALSTIDHHGVCRLFDVTALGEEGYCAVLEWINGKTIQQFCDGLRMPIKERVLLLVSALDSLGYVHTAGFVHGDIKGEHVLATPDLRTKLIDFGSARTVVQSPDSNAEPFDLTPEYASPEVLKGDRLDARSDLYSFGIMMYRVLVGRYPFRVRSGLLPNIADSILNEDPEPALSLLAPQRNSSDGTDHQFSVESEESLAAKRSVSSAKLRVTMGTDLSLIMLRSIQKDPMERYQSASELAHDLRSWLGNRQTVAAAYRDRLLKTEIEMFDSQLKLFLCHCSENKPEVRELYRRLRSIGISAWFDEEDLLPGQEWRDEIPRAVGDADVVVVCLSEHSLTKKGFVQKEIRFALDVADEQPSGRIFIIPVRLVDCDVPDRLKKWQWVNLFEDHGFDRLVKALRYHLASKGTKKP
jgi:serine/threonine protein kinase